MSIYASAVALWFMAIALFLTGASIGGWSRSPRAHEYAVIEMGSIARRPATRQTSEVST
jgi:hypothetical protein